MNRKSIIIRKQLEEVYTIRELDKRDAIEYLSEFGESFSQDPPTSDSQIAGCLSKSYFRVRKDERGVLHIYGCSESVILWGVMAIMKECFDSEPADEVKECGITWVKESGLLELLTPQRQGAVQQMIDRILKAC